MVDFKSIICYEYELFIVMRVHIYLSHANIFAFNVF